jgi:hypothetical protein
MLALKGKGPKCFVMVLIIVVAIPQQYFVMVIGLVVIVLRKNLRDEGLWIVSLSALIR